MDNTPQSIIIKVVTSDPAEPYSLSRRFKVEAHHDFTADLRKIANDFILIPLMKACLG